MDIEGNMKNIGEVCQGRKCVMVINVASKWGLTKPTYTELV
jgi:hypothetical protein